MKHSLIRLMAPLLLLTAICVGCDKNVAWTDTVSIPEKGWTSDHQIIFELDPKAYEPEENKYELMTARAVGDTVPRLRGDFHAYLSLRYKEDCIARSVRLAFEQASLDDEIRTDTLEFRLFDDAGRSLGRGRFGINETSVILPYPLKAGLGTVITVTPVNYPEPITNLLSLTLTLRTIVPSSSSVSPQSN